MKVPFVHGPGDLRLDQIEPPVPGPRDVLIRVGTVGICGSDFAYTAMGGTGGRSATAIPLGHELSGTVAGLGREVSGWRVGDRVVINPYINSIGNGGPEGGFAELLLIRDLVGQPDQLVRMPDGMTFDAGALVEPLAVSMHGVNRSGARPGDKVAIFGAGPIGLGAVALLRERGVGDIVIFDPSPFRRARAERLGAAAAIDPTRERPADVLARLHGGGSLWGQPIVHTSKFIDMAGAPGIIEGVVDMAPLGATLIVTAVVKTPVTLNFQTVLGRELTIAAAMGYPDEFPEAVRLLSEGLDVEPMVSHRFAGADFLEAFETASNAGNAAKVLVQYDR